VGFVGYNQSVGSAQSQIDAAIKDMKAQGWDVLSIDPQGNVANANSACVNYTNRGVSFIVISVFDPTQMGQCVAAAESAKIPFFYFGSSLGAGAVGSMGTTLAAPLNNLFIKQWSGNSKVEILALGLTPAAPCRDRYTDLISKWTAAGNSPALVDFQDMNIEIGTLVDGQTKTQQWLTAHPAGSGTQLVIWACSGGAASGAVAAILAAHRTDVPVYSWDFTAQEAQYVQKGLVAATAWPDTDPMASAFVTMVKNYFSTKKSQGSQDAPYVIITPQTYAKFLASHPGAISN
jgi:ABC-type sugar transport system substrate-binding protein